jgi:GTP-binding protein
LAIRLLDGDTRVQQALQSGELAELVAKQRRSDTRFSRKIALEGTQ